jgi:2-oxoglutarate ferredoxin oxidoreductase subunit gamma
MKHYQKVGRTEHGIHPKDAHFKVNESGEMIEIVEGEFLQESRPDFKEAINQRKDLAEKYWQGEKDALDKRKKLPPKKEKVSRTEIQLGGFGGQGIMSAGKIIGMAASVYGSQVVISSKPIHHPHLTQPTSMIMMSQGAYEKYIADLKQDGVLLIDDELVTLPEDHRDDIKTFGISATKIAKDAGNNRAANTAMLGFWTAVERIVDKEAMQEAIAESVPAKTVSLNLEVFEAGYKRGLELDE